MAEDLAADLAGAFSVSDTKHSIHAPHPRFGQYKFGKTAADCQEERRRDFLNQQKQKRFDYATRARSIALEEDETEEVEPMDLSQSPRTRQSGHRSRRYKDQLMLSEWLVEVPPDMGEEWLMVPSPVGKRSLVVAAKGMTTSYSKSGWLMNQFPSHLPGGNSANRKGYCLLDCLYSETERVYYVLDLICWNSNPLYDSETEFRFFWVACKLSETTGLEDRSKTNPYPMRALPYCACGKDAMENFMGSSIQFPVEQLDGLLFFHKRAHYWPGPTPLVGWLKPFMLSEILGVAVPPIFQTGHEQETAAAFREEFDRTHGDKPNK